MNKRIISTIVIIVAVLIGSYLLYEIFMNSNAFPGNKIFEISITPGSGLDFDIHLLAKGSYSSSGYGINADTEIKGNEILINIKSKNGKTDIISPKGPQLAVISKAGYGKSMHDLEGDYILKINYISYQDIYDLKSTKDYVQVKTKKSSFTELVKEPLQYGGTSNIKSRAPLQEIKIYKYPENTINISCTSSKCPEFYNDLAKLNIKEADPNNEYIKEQIAKNPKLHFYQYSGNLGNLKEILEKYSKLSVYIIIEIRSSTGETCFVLATNTQSQEGNEWHCNLKSGIIGTKYNN